MRPDGPCECGVEDWAWVGMHSGGRDHMLEGWHCKGCGEPAPDTCPCCYDEVREFSLWLVGISEWHRIRSGSML